MPSTASMSSWLNETFGNKFVQYGAVAAIIFCGWVLAHHLSSEIAE